MSYVSANKRDNYEDQGKRLLRTFLFRTNLNLEVKNRFMDLEGNLNTTARLYKEHIYALKRRNHIMANDVWNQELAFLIEYFRK